MKIISRKEAKAQGLSRYFTGKPCKNGHVAERRTASSHCVGCRAEANARWYASNQDRCLEVGRRWKNANKERRAETNKKWRMDNIDRCKQVGRRYYEENRERALKQGKRWREENRQHHLYLVNRWRRKQRATNPEYRMRESMRDMLKRTVTTKTDRTHKMLGYSAADLKQHIERQFTKGMSWDNHGEWHIDHVVSIAQLIREGETDPAVINSLANLRPMWAKDNMAKGSERQFLL